ncbi:hypothetical protein PF004_g14070 [Phytophthora fragariae]|uniref:Reverse transcriptase domain-containing protein n=1 Tax=Phytophthora fragariae TaxID=53985 RepID=A0A6G0NQD8_9STRA|nr:hypothetical protein PF004_g14070 [Phytophthora fragariae]
MRAEAQSAAQASATNTASFAARPTTTKPVKMSVPTFDGKDADSLVFWVREIKIALSAGQIYDARAQVVFALSNLGRVWAMARETATPGYFTSWSFMEQELRSTFLLANVAYRHCSSFLRCKQGKRSLQDYVMELHDLEAAMAGAPLSEDIKVTVFMDGVRTGPVRTELFRRQPKTFNEAVHIAMLEDHCVRSAQGHTPHVEASEGPTPMEISLAESARSQKPQRASGRCFGCNQPSHFRRNSPTNPWKAQRDKKYAARPALNSLEATESENGDSQSGRGDLLKKLRSSLRKVGPSPTSPKEQVPGTTLLCLSVAAARSSLVVATASVKGYPEPMTVLIDSGASFNFATKASVARNSALYASALEASNSNTNVSVRLATGSIVSTRKVTIPLSVKFDDFNSVEPFIVLDMDDRYDLIPGMPWLAKHEPWIDWRSRTIGASHNSLADRTLASHIPSSSRDGFVHEHRVPRGERQFAGTSEVLELPMALPPQARELEGAGAGARATTSGRAGVPTFKGKKSDKATSATKAEASSRDADSAAEDKVPRVFDVFTGELKVGEVLTPLPTVAELLELEELSYVEFMDSLKAGELAEVVLLRPEGSSLELNSLSVMNPEVLEDERTAKRQTQYGAAVLKDPSDPYYALLKEFSDVVSDDPPSVLPPDRGVRHEIDLVPGTKFCTTRQWPLPKEQVDVIDAFFAAKHAAGMVRESKSPHSSPTFCARKPNGKWRMVHAFNKLNAATIPASTPIPRKDVLQNNMAGCSIFSALDIVDGYYQLLMRESDIPLTAVSTPSGMLWEWLVMPKGLSNAPATFNRLVTQLFRPMRQFVQTYFDDIFVHSRASEGKTAVEAHLGHTVAGACLAEGPA